MITMAVDKDEQFFREWVHLQAAFYEGSQASHTFAKIDWLTVQENLW